MDKVILRRETTFLLLLLITSLPLSAANRRYYDEDIAIAIREMRDSVDALSHEVANHETEIHMFEERENNQESTLSSLRQQVLDSNQANKEMLKGFSTGIEGKIANLENSNKGIISDISQLKTHSNDAASVLSQYKQKITDLEKIIALQSQNIENLQSAMLSLTEALAGTTKGSAASEGSAKAYRVKAGDSLEKIARANNTTIKALKELNSLTSDRIIVGQNLQIP